MSEAVGLRLRARSGGGIVEMLFTENSLCIREAARRGMDDVPDLVGMFLGTAIDPRKGGKGGFFEPGGSTDIVLGDSLAGTDGTPEIRVTQVPYACILRSFLARPGRFRHAKFAFDCYDQRRGKVTSREFLLDASDAARVEMLLSSVMPDRLEIH